MRRRAIDQPVQCWMCERCQPIQGRPNLDYKGEPFLQSCDHLPEHHTRTMMYQDRDCGHFIKKTMEKITFKTIHAAYVRDDKETLEEMYRQIVAAIHPADEKMQEDWLGFIKSLLPYSCSLELDAPDENGEIALEFKSADNPITFCIYFKLRIDSYEQMHYSLKHILDSLQRLLKDYTPPLLVDEAAAELFHCYYKVMLSTGRIKIEPQTVAPFVAGYKADCEIAADGYSPWRRGRL